MTSPLGGITLSSNGTELTGLWFDGQNILEILSPKNMKKSLSRYLSSPVHWLDIYFSAKPAIHTAAVYAALAVNPYGKLC